MWFYYNYYSYPGIHISLKVLGPKSSASQTTHHYKIRFTNERCLEAIPLYK